MSDTLKKLRYNFLTLYKRAEKEISLCECVSPNLSKKLEESSIAFARYVRDYIDSKSSEYPVLLRESAIFIKKSAGFNALGKVMLNESFGFENPFDDFVPQPKLQYHVAPIVKQDFSGVKILGVSAWNSDVDNKVIYRDGIVRAGEYFHKGDVIEKSPVRIIHNQDMYSPVIRDIAFPIDEEKGIYGIPFGYAAWYRDSESSRNEPNVDYECDIINDEEGYIQIYAIKNIRRGEEIIIDSTSMNTIGDYSLSLLHDRSRQLSTKNFKLD